MTEATETKAAAMPEIKPGMVVRVHEKIEDVNAKGEKRMRIQVFEGLVLGVRGAGASRNFRVRKETDGFGVEKIYPLSSPNISKVEVVKQFRVRRAKLSFIKDFGRKLKEVSKK
ncbi:50S ribosomal protein L19 [Candidatus Uhrbacteria bacterium]|nr:50S ribosomal protein L19 [Candidatus Uhrbacteria bacterium]